MLRILTTDPHRHDIDLRIAEAEITEERNHRNASQVIDHRREMTREEFVEKCNTPCSD